jgi:hypothetical protein
VDCTENTTSNSLSLCMIYRFKNIFTAPLPTNGRLLFHNSSFQPLCHIAPSLWPLLVPSSLQAYHYFFFSKVICLLTSMIAFANSTSTSCLLRCFFQSQQHLPFAPHGLDLALLFPNFSLLTAAHLKHHTYFVGSPPSMCFCDCPSPVIVTGTTLHGWTSVLTSA